MEYGSEMTGLVDAYRRLSERHGLPLSRFRPANNGYSLRASNEHTDLRTPRPQAIPWSNLDYAPPATGIFYPFQNQAEPSICCPRCHFVIDMTPIFVAHGAKPMPNETSNISAPPPMVTAQDTPADFSQLLSFQFAAHHQAKPPSVQNDETRFIPPFYPDMHSTDPHSGDLTRNQYKRKGFVDNTTTKSVPAQQTLPLKRTRLVWTEGLHARFEQAIEKLGIEKAVPKSILEVMAVDGLTRENVASHLQKYRQHLNQRLPRDEKLNIAAENSASTAMAGHN